MVLKELLFNSLYFGKVWCQFLEITDFLTVYTLGRCGVLKELIFNSFLCWEGMVVLKELMFHSFHFGRV